LRVRCGPPQMVLMGEQSLRLEQEAEVIAAKLAEARLRASEELQRVERLERLLNDALRSHEHEELDGAVVSISAELQVCAHRSVRHQSLGRHL